jgi:rhodanese-related sulfurtransferase
MSVTQITVEELRLMMDSGEAIRLIDVREPYEYEEFNLGGKLIPLGELAANLSDLEAIKDDEIVIHCRSGKRSAAACAFLSGMGFSHIKNLQGGIIAWVEHYGML